MFAIHSNLLTTSHYLIVRYLIFACSPDQPQPVSYTRNAAWNRLTLCGTHSQYQIDVSCRLKPPGFACIIVRYLIFDFSLSSTQADLISHERRTKSFIPLRDSCLACYWCFIFILTAWVHMSYSQVSYIRFSPSSPPPSLMWPERRAESICHLRGLFLVCSRYF